MPAILHSDLLGAMHDNGLFYFINKLYLTTNAKLTLQKQLFFVTCTPVATIFNK